MGKYVKSVQSTGLSGIIDKVRVTTIDAPGYF